MKSTKFFFVFCVVGLIPLMIYVGVGVYSSLVIYRIILPDHYIGWVRVHFNVHSAPPLQVHRHVATFPIPETGYLQTNSNFVESDNQHYILLYQQGKKLVPIPTELYVNEFELDGFTMGTEGISWYFFVGPKPLREKYKIKALDDPTFEAPTPGRLASEN